MFYSRHMSLLEHSMRTGHLKWKMLLRLMTNGKKLMDMLSFHTSVFGFEKLSEEVLAYHEAFGRFPTFEALFVNDQA